MASGSARVAIIAAIPDLLRGQGIDPVKALRQAGIPEDIFENSDNVISFDSRNRLLNTCAKMTGCNHFGLLVGEQSGLSTFGLFGYLIKHSSNVEAALRTLVHYFHLHAQGSIVVVEGDDAKEQAFLGYGIYQPQHEAIEQVIDAAVAVAFNILCELCGPNFAATRVCLSHRKPMQQAPFKRFFKAPLVFDESRNGVYFPASWLRASVQGADPELHRLIDHQISLLKADHIDDFPAQVRRVLYPAVLAKRASGNDVAKLFSMHSRTLHRHLSETGTSFQGLLDECRFSIAQQLLGQTNLDRAKIADVLGYSDGRAFSRAFTRWSGVTPSRWRGDNRV